MPVTAAPKVGRHVYATRAPATTRPRSVPGTRNCTLATAEYGLGVRAEILLARGEVEAGLRMWRRTVAQLQCADDRLEVGDPTASIDRSLFLHPLLREIQAVAVVAHAQHGKLGLVKETVAELAEHLPDELERAAGPPQPLLAQSPIYGAVLLALGMVVYMLTDISTDVVALADSSGVGMCERNGDERPVWKLLFS